jgi:cytochrome c biogenesis protein ResB
MDTNNTESAAQVNSTTPAYQPSEKKIGPIVAILVIVVVLVAAAIYFFAGRGTDAPVPENTTAASEEVQPVTNNSDEVSDIEADLNASVNGLDDQNF